MGKGDEGGWELLCCVEGGVVGEGKVGEGRRGEGKFGVGEV